MSHCQTYAELLQVVDGDAVAEEVEESILKHAAVSVADGRLAKGIRFGNWKLCSGGNLRENETVTVEPVGVLGVELHELVEQDVSDRRHTPRK